MRSEQSAKKNMNRTPSESIISRVQYGNRSSQAEHKLSETPYDSMMNQPRTEELRGKYQGS